MAESWLKRWFKKSRPVACKAPGKFGKNRFVPAVECLTERIVPAITVSFSQSAGQLTVVGDALDNEITISSDDTGAVLVNGGDVTVTGGTPMLSNVSLIRVFGQAGNDVITLDETNGALPRAELNGGTGDDTLTAGSGADRLFGQAGNDVLIGNAGNDFAQGDEGNDMLFLGAGNDTFQAVPGTGFDTVEGQGGIDTMVFFGSNAGDSIDLSAAAGRVLFSRDTSSADMNGVEQIDIRVFGGADSIVVGDLSGTDMAGMSLDLGRNDGASDLVSVFGTQGDDNFGVIGDPGYVRVFGLQASISIFSNEAADRLMVDALAGVDVVNATSLRAGGIQLTMNGGAGEDTLTGSEGNDLIIGGADNDTVRMNAGNDSFVWNSGDGSDTVDGQAGADRVIFNGTDGDDVVDVYGWETNVAVVGLGAELTMVNVEAGKDSLFVNALDGADGITASTVDAGIVQMTLDGGAGNDVILGSKGADVLLAGAGDDFVYGDQGNDLAILGSGDDYFQWDAGNGSDTVEGQDGTDLIIFYGSDDGENIEVSANGGRVAVDWDGATVSSDDVEQLDMRTWGGADNIVLNDLTGTDVTGIGLDLGRDDGAADSVTVRGTEGDDNIGVLGDPGWVQVYGLHATVSIFSNEAVDSLTIDALAGADVVDASSLLADGIQLTLDGGLGDDSLTGSEGDDLITGGEGDDILIGGAGMDVLDGGPGDNTIIQ